MNTTVQVAYTAVGPQPYSRPPREGPQMTAVCCALVEAAIARGSRRSRHQRGNEGVHRRQLECSCRT